MRYEHEKTIAQHPALMQYGADHAACDGFRRRGAGCSCCGNARVQLRDGLHGGGHERRLPGLWRGRRCAGSLPKIRPGGGSSGSRAGTGAAAGGRTGAAGRTAGERTGTHRAGTRSGGAERRGGGDTGHLCGGRGSLHGAGADRSAGKRLNLHHQAGAGREAYQNTDHPTWCY